MPQVMEHVRELADVIGPRPATTDTEAEAADYIQSVFEARGLEVERQEFDCPRTYSWTFVVYHLVTIGAAVVSRWSGPVALVLAVASAVVLWLDLDTRFSVSRFLPKGPSQNIIARHIPRARRGERTRRIVIVAHYDSTKASLAFSPGMVKNFNLSFALMKYTTFATPLVIAFGMLPFAKGWRPWTWYAALAASAYLVFPLLINVHRELFMHATDGANDNASGVAAMLGVMEATVPEPDDRDARPTPRRYGAQAAHEADVVLDDALLEYRPQPGATSSAAGDGPLGFDDIGWETGPLPPSASADRTPGQPHTLAGRQSAFVMEQTEEEPTVPASGFVPPGGSWDDEDVTWDDRSSSRRFHPDDEVPDEQGRFSFDAEEPSVTSAPPKTAPSPDPEPDATRGRDSREARGIRDWLGVGRGFEVRRAGKEIGSWENLSDDDDEFGFKAGSAGDFDLADDAFASDEAARIRRRVTEQVDRALAEKEIWFVATGAEESGTWGMRALLDAYGEELRDALFINIDNVGAGAVAFVTEEGMARRYHCDRRLASQAKRTARENELPVRGVPYHGLSTDATPALARRYRAMSVMAFDINGRLPNWHWATDTVDNVQERTIEQAVTFVTLLLRDL